jgi:hypothetical protein
MINNPKKRLIKEALKERREAYKTFTFKDNSYEEYDRWDDFKLTIAHKCRDRIAYIHSVYDAQQTVGP